MRRKEEIKQEIMEKLLELLEKNSREKNKSLAKKLNISEKTVKRYVNYLVKSGKIKSFTIIRSSSYLEAYVNINVIKGTSTSQVCKQLSSMNYCRDISEVSGEYDILCRVTGTSIEDLNSKIDEIRNIKGIERTRSFIVLRKWN